jgi:gamma-glutamyltranspeptidase/glutathione hydrolase
VSWARLFQPAIKYAREGFPVSSYLAGAIKSMENYVNMFPGTREVLTDPKTGALLAEGALLRQPKLAVTLQRIADSGSSDLFYVGTHVTPLLVFIQTQTPSNKHTLSVCMRVCVCACVYPPTMKTLVVC